MSSPSESKTSFQRNLLGWYRKHQRPLPWRKTKDPYKIWVSEVMLQQTRVETVIPYYENFLQKFETLQDLSDASEDDVLNEWKGLGYYRRAKFLHKAAREVTEKYNGKLPTSSKELMKLPGFGSYTSGSVASIAFSEATPAVDGNVKRVLSRIFATHNDVTSIADQLSKNDSPSEWTQSLMELGALICIPKNPKCLVCPVQKNCTALANQQVDKYPQQVTKKAPKKIYATVWMIQHPQNQKLWVQKRPDEGRWARMWEFPTIETQKKKPLNELELYQKVQKPRVLNSFKHLLTHLSIELDVICGTASHDVKNDRKITWVGSDKVQALTLSRMQQKAFEIYLTH